MKITETDIVMVIFLFGTPTALLANWEVFKIFLCVSWILIMLVGFKNIIKQRGGTGT